ncbi:hypothetical protein DNTS_023882 [Danionella cerebrum]|uniref:Lipase domain-containing protein n=1 Tax=Danionella cerebrum TaxID=2873325 RepID=A0A553MUU9_9TELE|nr:hypothetical protein DNTS_023882 [Danionella translucida]
MFALRVFLLLYCHFFEARGSNLTDGQRIPVKSRFHLYHSGELFEDTCVLLPFQSESLQTCGYNQSQPVTIIIHGWTMNGLMEKWIFSLASALKHRLQHVNVLISDWRNLALQPYPIAAKNSRQVGGDLATMLKWLQDVAQLSLDEVHLIGYSLGAHVAGFAGSHFRGAQKIGRITGLDPAGPHFEGALAPDRLSPDDAQLVDAIHTSAGSRLMPGVGITQRVAHLDFYPNGGAFQPGCKFSDVYANVYRYGLQGVPRTIKCSHERSVRLFTESVQNGSAPALGFRCRDQASFTRGRCLDCRSQRCNPLGLSAQKQRNGGNTGGLFLNTGPLPPYRVFHYQIRMQLKFPVQIPELSVFVTLNGSGGETSEKPLTLYQDGAQQKLFSSLLSFSSDPGELFSLKLLWKGEHVWWSWFNQVWSKSNETPKLSIWRIRIKAGETQHKDWFCGTSVTRLKIAEPQEFRRCHVLQKNKAGTQNHLELTGTLKPPENTETVEKPGAETQKPPESTETIEKPKAETLKSPESTETIEKLGAQTLKTPESTETIEKPKAETLKSPESTETIEKPKAETLKPLDSTETIEKLVAQTLKTPESTETIEKPKAETLKSPESTEFIENPKSETLKPPKSTETIEKPRAETLKPPESTETTERHGAETQKSPESTETTERHGAETLKSTENIEVIEKPRNLQKALK